MSARSLCIWVALAVSLLLNSSTRLHAQAVVNFNNSVLFDLGCGEVVIRGPDGSPLEGTNYVAQLYYGASASSLVAHTSAPARFRPPSTPGGRGLWLGGSRTLTGVAPGQLAVLSVRAWDIRSGATYEQAAVRVDNGPFYYEVPSGPNPDPTNFFMFNFRANNSLTPIPANPPPPVIHVQPQSQTVRPGENVTFTIAVSNAWLHHWRFNGNVIDLSMPCHDARTVFLTNVQPSHAGSYRFIAENYTGSVTSEVAVLTVETPPQWGEVNFANSVAFQTLADRLIRGSDGTLLVGSDLSQPPSFVAQLYYGANAGSLIPVTNAPARFRPGSTGQWIGGIRSLPGFLPGQPVVLLVRVWDASCSATYQEANCRAVGGTFSYTPPPHGSPPEAYYMEGFRGITGLGLGGNFPPTILQQPTNQVAYVGQTVIFWVVASNQCKFQWQFNGVNLPNGPCEMLRIDNVQISQAGDYRVIINEGNFVGVTSQVARLTVLVPPLLSASRYEQGSFAFQVSGNGGTVVIETAPDLNPATTWTPVFTNTTPFWFTNSAPADRQRFYRTVFR